MAATHWEYRFRYMLHALAYMLGFWAPWARYLPQLGLSTKSTWLALSAEMARQGWLTFGGAVQLLLAIAVVLTGLGAALRVWGTAYVGSGVVNSGAMHGSTLLADGPYRRTRNPLYLGTLLHTLGVALLMPPSGALLAVAFLWLLQIRLALAEEPFLKQRFGDLYTSYRERVPRFLPSPTPLVPSAGQRAHWLQAFAGEIHFVGVFLTLLVAGWSFNLSLIFRGVLIFLGVAIVMRAFLVSPERVVKP